MGRKYKWVYDGSDCIKCRSLDGRVFDYKPNIEEISHPNCKCRVVEIGEREAEELKIEREVELSRRDDVAKYIRDNVKIEKNGKWHNPITRLEEKNGKYGDCARYVSNAIQAEFPNYKRVRDAKDSGGSLEKIGFMKIKTIKGLKFPESYIPQIGDIIIIQPPKENLEKHKDGHIAMYNGKQWISDFKQNNPNGIIWSDASKYTIESAIYRNPEWN